MKLAIVEWEDIVGVTHQPLPRHDANLKEWQLVKQTIGYVIEFAEYLVVVTDYDVTHQGSGYCHNDYTMIPRGVVRSVHDLYMTEEHGDRPLYDLDEGQARD